MRNILQNPKAPNQPIAPVVYTSTYFNIFSDALRLYFNRLDAMFQSLLGTRGGKFLQFPYGAITRTSDQLATADNTATQILFDTTEYASGMSLDLTDGVHVEQSGIYNYQFSIQFANTDTSQIHEATVWLKNSSGDIPRTASKWSVHNKHSGVDGYTLATCNFFIELQADDWVELWWAGSKVKTTAPADGIYIEYYAASTSPYNRPAIPSVVATLSFVSNLSA